VLWLCLAAGASAQVAVVTRSAEDHEVATQLGRLIDVAVNEHAEPEARSVAGTLADAAAWPEPLVVVIDRPDDTVHVLRTRDHSAVSRVLDPGVMLDSQYAVALATAELLEWMGVLPAARGRPSGVQQPARPAAPAAASTTAEPAAGEGGGSLALGWAAGADLELATSPGYDVSLVRPSIHAEAQLGRARAPLWLELGGRLGAPASWDRKLDATLFETAAERVEYSDTQVALHAALGFGSGRATLLGELEGGVSFAQVEAEAAAGEEVGGHDGLSGWLGLGLGLRYPLASGLGLAAAVQGQWLTERARYRIEGSPVLEEGPIRVVTRLGLIWESALLP
jgi:hypothetical protein